MLGFKKPFLIRSTFYTVCKSDSKTAAGVANVMGAVMVAAVAAMAAMAAVAAMVAAMVAAWWLL